MLESDTDIYDFETIIEDALSSVMADNGITTVTPRTANKFQKERSRVEALFETGQAKQSYHIVDGQLRNASWNGVLTIEVVTESGTGDQSAPAHRQFRSRVRNLMAVMKDSMNGVSIAGDVLLPRHQIQNIVETGNTPTYKHESGIETSRFTYAVDFGVARDGWGLPGDWVQNSDGGDSLIIPGDPLFAGQFPYDINAARVGGHTTHVVWNFPQITFQNPATLQTLGLWLQRSTVANNVSGPPNELFAVPYDTSGIATEDPNWTTIMQWPAGRQGDYPLFFDDTESVTSLKICCYRLIYVYAADYVSFTAGFSLRLNYPTVLVMPPIPLSISRDSSSGTPTTYIRFTVPDISLLP